MGLQRSKNASKGLRYVKGGGISVRKAGQMWRLSMKKSTLTQVRLNRRATLTVGLSPYAIFFFLTKNEGKETGLQMG